MRYKWKVVALMLASVFLIFCSKSNKGTPDNTSQTQEKKSNQVDVLPDNLTTDSMNNAENFELLSLRSAPLEKEKDQEIFHTWKVHRKCSVSDIGIREKIIFSLRKDLKRFFGAKACASQSRYGIRITLHGTVIDYLIDFNCGEMSAFMNEELLNKGFSIFISNKARSIIDEVLSRAETPLSK